VNIKILEHVSPSGGEWERPPDLTFAVLKCQAVYREKFARLWMILATSVVFREAFSVGSCWEKPKSVGERIAGQMNRRKTQELTSWSQTSWLRWLWQRCRSAENTLFSSLQITTTTSTMIMASHFPVTAACRLEFNGNFRKIRVYRAF